MQGVGVRGRDLLPREDLVRAVEVHDLVARAHERDARRAMHQRCAVRDGGEDAELRRAERRSPGERHGARPDVLAPVPHVAPAVPVVAHRHAPVWERLRVFLADDAVRARGERRAGEDAGDLPRAERPLGEPARGDGLDDAERHRALGGGARHVRRADGIAVHRGIVPGRQVDRAGDVLGEHEVQRLPQGAPHRLEGSDVLEDQAGRFGGRQHLRGREPWRGPRRCWRAS